MALQAPPDIIACGVVSTIIEKLLIHLNKIILRGKTDLITIQYIDDLIPKLYNIDVLKRNNNDVFSPQSAEGEKHDMIRTLITTFLISQLNECIIVYITDLCEDISTCVKKYSDTMEAYNDINIHTNKRNVDIYYMSEHSQLKRKKRKIKESPKKSRKELKLLCLNYKKYVLF